MLNHRKHLLTLLTLSLLTACDLGKDSNNDKGSSHANTNTSGGNNGNAGLVTGSGSGLHPNIERVSSCDEHSAFAQDMLRLINETRTQGYTCRSKDKRTGAITSIVMPSVSTVTWNAQLCQAAQFHSQDMAANNFHNHIGSKKDTFSERIKNQGYNYRLASENIAAGYSTAEAVHQGWLDSTSGHCENVMNVDVEEVGVAMAKTLPGKSKYTHYWTENFANPL